MKEHQISAVSTTTKKSNLRICVGFAEIFTCEVNSNRGYRTKNSGWFPVELEVLVPSAPRPCGPVQDKYVLMKNVLFPGLFVDKKVGQTVLHVQM